MECPITLPPPPVAASGSYEKRAGTYRSMAGFLRQRQQRLFSRERDVGLRWRDGEALYRAAWIQDTRELDLVQLGAPEQGGGHVELLAGGVEAEALEEDLAGWQEAQDDGDHSLEWLRRRVRGLLARERAVAA